MLSAYSGVSFSLWAKEASCRRRLGATDLMLFEEGQALVGRGFR
jgi:hypothetical protein